MANQEEEQEVLQELTTTLSSDSAESEGEELPSNNEDNDNNERESDDDDALANRADKDKGEEESLPLSDEESSSNKKDKGENPAMFVGGQRQEPAYAILSGVLETEPSDTVTVALTRLPATLGRSHDTEDSHFFGIGDLKTVSRQQCAIHYQNSGGGRLGQFQDGSEKFSYRPPAKNYSKQTVHASKQPQTGYYVVECLGKNRIVVNGERVEKGELAVLQHGSPIRMNALCLYFLLPSNAPERTMEVPHPAATQPRKRKAPTPAAGSPAKKPATTKRKPGHGAWAAELETLSLDDLMERMSEAIESDVWERKHQMIGSAIAVHAVKAAGLAKPILDMANEDATHGVARSEIMAWIQANPTFSEWVSHMNSKMEPKSYQTNINKALVKAGFVRTGTTGRHVKWTLPPSDIEDGVIEKTEGAATDDAEEIPDQSDGKSNKETE